jgi:hypothetical protein
VPHCVCCGSRATAWRRGGECLVTTIEIYIMLVTRTTTYKCKLIHVRICVTRVYQQYAVVFDPHAGAMGVGLPATIKVHDVFNSWE